MRLAVLELMEQEPQLEQLWLPRRFLAPGTRPANSLDDELTDELTEDFRRSFSGDSLRPTTALPKLFTPLRQRWATFGIGALAVLLALVGLAFVATGGQSSSAVRAAPASESERHADSKPAVPEASEVFVELYGVPSGARVLLDGRPVEGNPLKLVRGSGEHEIKVEAEGMQAFTVLHDAGRDGRYAVSLEPLPRAAKEQRPRSRRQDASKKPDKNGLLRRPDF
jgi:hypothetical protein